MRVAERERLRSEGGDGLGAQDANSRLVAVVNGDSAIVLRV